MEPFLRHLQPGDGVIDVGANTGEFTRRFATVVGPTGTVIAVEPDPVNVFRLQEHVKALPWVQIEECAVADPLTISATFFCDTQERKRNSLWVENLLGPAQQIHVPCVTLDQLARRVPNLKAIKVDTQGAELDVLAGAAETLKRTDLMWMVEVWPAGLKVAGGSIFDLADIFSAHGYHPTSGTWAALCERIKDCTGHKAVDVFLVHQ